MTNELLSTTEAALRLGVTPEDVYRLVFAGQLEGRPDEDGVVRISTQAVEEYLEREAHV
jgi:excisionase family DNA binding protein